MLYNFNCFPLFIFHLSIASGVVDVSLGFRGRVVRDIACGIVDIGLSNGVDESSVEGVVNDGGMSVGNVRGGIGQSIPRGSKSSIGKAIHKGSNCGSFISWASKGHGGEGEQSEALHDDDCQARKSAHM